MSRAEEEKATGVEIVEAMNYLLLSGSKERLRNELLAAGLIEKSPDFHWRFTCSCFWGNAPRLEIAENVGFQK